MNFRFRINFGFKCFNYATVQRHCLFTVHKDDFGAPVVTTSQCQYNYKTNVLLGDHTASWGTPDLLCWHPMIRCQAPGLMCSASKNYFNNGYSCHYYYPMDSVLLCVFPLR